MFAVYLIVRAAINSSTITHIWETHMHMCTYRCPVFFDRKGGHMRNSWPRLLLLHVMHT